MRVLVACEYSQIVTKEFRSRGHEAFSCDILETDGNPDWHYQCDVKEVLNDSWDMMIAHPPCTYLTNAGNKWLFEDSAKCTVEERLKRRDQAIEFFKLLLNAPIEKIAIENPTPHPYLIEKVGRYQDKIQPWMFGDPETKGVCLWLKNLPPLLSTMIETSRQDLKFRMGPSPERDKLRSRFFVGIAKAMADQWG